jgi:hypothetical protein
MVELCDSYNDDICENVYFLGKKSYIMWLFNLQLYAIKCYLFYNYSPSFLIITIIV